MYIYLLCYIVLLFLSWLKCYERALSCMSRAYTSSRGDGVVETQEAGKQSRGDNRDATINTMKRPMKSLPL